VFIVDTNVLVNAAIRECAAHARARSLVDEWAGSAEPWLTTWSVVYEFLRVTTHRNIFRRPLTFGEAWSFVEALQTSLSFALLMETDRHSEVVRGLTREYPHISGNRMHDLHIAAVMREHGIAEIRTADTDFRQFKFLVS
jgi:toxin-antitoxin system PIN domain toxin